jgi:type VI protein secretion system component Hcp
MAIWVEFSSPISKYFEALSASMGMGPRAVAGGPIRKAQLGDFQLTKRNDNLSPKLVQHCARGTVFALVTLEFYTKTDILYGTYKLTNVIITSFHLGGSGGDGVPMENLSVNAEAMSYEYFKTSSDL